MVSLIASANCHSTRLSFAATFAAGRTLSSTGRATSRNSDPRISNLSFVLCPGFLRDV